jgi:hypothetical protein
MSRAKPSTFDVASQSAQTISNVGGDHNVYVDGARSSRARTVARAVWALGLASVFAGLAVLVLTGVDTAHNFLAAQGDEGISAPYTQYVAATWIPAVALLGGGVVLTGFARVFAGR